MVSGRFVELGPFRHDSEQPKPGPLLTKSANNGPELGGENNQRSKETAQGLFLAVPFFGLPEKRNGQGQGRCRLLAERKKRYAYPRQRAAEPGRATKERGRGLGRRS